MDTLGRVIAGLLVLIAVAFTVNWIAGREPETVEEAVHGAAEESREFLQGAANDLQSGADEVRRSGADSGEL